MKVFSFFSLLVITLVILLAVVVNSAATTEKQPEENPNDSSEPEVPIVPTTEVANVSSKETANVPSTNVPNVPSTDADPITAPRSASRPLAICDIGSNGIRFEIMSSLDQGGMHVLYKERAPISLLNAQQTKELENESIASASSSASEVQTQSRSPVSDPVLKEIDGSALKDIDGSMSRFAEIAQNYNAELRICATEASRTAPNSEALLERIKTATGETVRLLSKAEESTLTALGVSATLWNPCGPVMDLGGGSLELNYLNNKGEPLNLNEDFGKALSIPYGAGIVQKRLDEALKAELQSDPETSPNRKVLDEVSRAIEDAKATMKVDELNTCAGRTLYLTGGGFRAIGYLAMYYLNHPFSIINGFTITASKLQEICEVYAAKSQKDLKADLKQVRSIGVDRYPQISADLLVIRAALNKLKPVDVTFAEGGVPHGLALNTMPPKERQRDPLAVSADEYAQRMGSALQKGEKEAFDEKMKAAYDAEKVGSAKIPPRVVDAAIRLVHLGDSPNVKVQAGGVFHLILRAPLLGLTHQDRAMLLIILINRYGGAIDKPDNERFNKIKEVAGGEEIANGCKFIGNMLRKAAMDVITVNAFAPVVALDITPPLAAGQEQLVVSADEYAKRMGSPVTDSEKKALETWISTAFSSQKIPSNVIQAAIRLVHLGDAASKDTRASNVFHLILRAPLLGLDSDRGDREMLLLILIHRYGGDLDVEEEGQLMEMKTKLKKGTGTNKKGTGIKKGTRIKKVVKKCKQIGKMLRLAMDVNAAGALEKKQVVLRRAEKIIEGSLEEVLEVVVKDKKAALVDVPYIKNRMENMGVELVKEF